MFRAVSAARVAANTEDSFCLVTHKGEASCSSCEAGQDNIVDREHLMNLAIMLTAYIINCG